MDIIYSCDNDFLDWVGISIASVLKNNPDEYFHFHLCTETPKHFKMDLLKDFYKNNEKVKISHLDCTLYDDVLDEYHLDKWGSKSYYTYWQLFAFDLLDSDTAWYLDSDIICLNKITNPVLEADKVIGCVLDTAHFEYKKMLGLKNDENFYNAGAFYVDIKKWKELKCTEKCINYIRNVRSNFTMADQDLFSLVLQKEAQIISPKYDYLAGYDYYGARNSIKMYSLDKENFYSAEEIENASREVVFYHCLGGAFGRPWEKDNNHPLRKEFKYYKEISCFPNFEKERKDSLIFKLERTAEILPMCIYVRIHNFAQRIFVRKLAKKFNSSTRN